MIGKGRWDERLKSGRKREWRKMTGEEMEGIRGKMGWMGDDWKREMG